MVELRVTRVLVDDSKDTDEARKGALIPRSGGLSCRDDDAHCTCASRQHRESGNWLMGIRFMRWSFSATFSGVPAD